MSHESLHTIRNSESRKKSDNFYSYSDSEKLQVRHENILNCANFYDSNRPYIDILKKWYWDTKSEF